MGSGLQRGTNATYGLLRAPNHGGVNVVIRSSAPGVARVAPDASTPGTDSVVIFVPDDQQRFWYHVQGIEGQTGTVTTTARATGFTDGTAPLNVVTQGVHIVNLGGSYSLSQAPDSIPFYTQVGIPYADNQYLSEAQSVRAGGSPLTVTLTSSQAAVANLVTSNQSGGSVTVQIPVGLYYSPTNVTGGGVALKKLTQGTTVVTSSIPGFITAVAAKAGVVMYTRAAARELGPLGIRVNAVSPGLIWREGLDEAWPDGVQRYRKAAPLGRLGRVDDVADACLFLVALAARWVTGAELVVDGGVLTSTAY